LFKQVTKFSAAVPSLVVSLVIMELCPAEPGAFIEPCAILLLFWLAFNILILGFLKSTFSNLSVVDLKKTL